MTAIIMIRGHDGIITAADGISYGPDGVVQGQGSKILLMPEHDTVITIQGPASLITLVRNRLGLEMDGFDDVIEDLPEALRGLCAEIEDRAGTCPMCNAYVGGWSKQRERFETYFIRSIPPEADGSEYSLPGEPWTLQPANAYMGAPWPDDEVAKRFGLSQKMLSAGPIDSLVLAVRFIAAARFISSDERFGNVPGTHMVGGFIQTAFLQREGCSTSIVHRWPDPAGEMVDPTRGEELPAWVRDRPVCMTPETQR
jgi:hypothetical protein